MAADYLIEQYRPELRPAIVDLQAHHWGTDLELNARYFEWKYERNPYLDEILICVATIGGEPVGMRGVYGACWRDGQARDLEAVGAGDLVIHPEHRNRFLPRRIMQGSADELAKRGFRCLINLSAGPFTGLASLRQGWTLVREHSVARAKLLLLQRVKAKVMRRARASRQLPAFAALDRRAETELGRRAGGMTIERRPRPGAMAALAERTQAPGRIHHVRDSSFFAWRFENPLSCYRFLFWQEATELDAYLVLQQPVTGARTVAFVDWGYASIGALRRLAALALRLCVSYRCSVWFGPLSPEESAVFRGAGFLTRPGGAGRYQPGLLVKSLASTDAVPAEAPLWHYRMIDSDAF